MNSAPSPRLPRGRLLFPRAAVLAFVAAHGLQADELAGELGAFVGVARLAHLLDVSSSWIRQLHRRGVLRGSYLRPPVEVA
jgi:hypothetical protein